MTKIRVLVVDDSAFMRKLITNILLESERIEVVGTARNGEDAIGKIQQLTPDVVTMDVEMPVLNGLDALKIIMQINPLPVIMLSSTTKEGAENTVSAIEHGAFDFVPKPSGTISLDLYKVKDELINKIILASSVNMKRLMTNQTRELKSSEGDINKRSERSLSKKLILLGTSTGGPRALQKVVTKLPKNLPAPVLIVQHMPQGFTRSLAERLNALSDIPVKEAENGEILLAGHAYIAPGGFHLSVNQVGNTIAAVVDNSSPVNGHRPSVDKLFISATLLTSYEKIAVIMTGMGSDGSEGIRQLKKTGKIKVIAESEETAVIYGMPKAAVKTGFVDIVLPLDEIAEGILKLI